MKLTFALCLFAVASISCAGSPSAVDPSLALNPAAPSLGFERTRLPAQIHAVAGPPKYCFLITIDDSDSRNNVIGTIRGAGSVFDLIDGRDPEPGTNPPIYNKYVLETSLLPVGTGDLRAEGGVMINSDVPAVVRNEYSQDTVLWWTLELGTGINPTRAEMQTRMYNEALINRGCTHYWHIIPGDNLDVAAAGQAGDLLSKFTAFP